MTKQMKVALIPDETRVIVNAGGEQLKVGDEIEIFEKTIDIPDPDKKDEYIGKYIITKDTLTITNVYESYSIARKQIKKKTTSLMDIASPMAKGNTYTEFKKINDDQTANLNVDSEDKTIRIGDFVQLI